MLEAPGSKVQRDRKVQAGIGREDRHRQECRQAGTDKQTWRGRYTPA
jgi:hypothetical protein